jgi:acetylornithine/succinyldiaminopimelate/putrescine aminotransferase
MRAESGRRTDDARQLFRRCGPLGPDAAAPLVIAKAEGAWLEDDGGQRILDFASGACAPFGHNHPQIAAALQAAGLLAAVEMAIRPVQAELMRKLAELAPGGMNRRVLVCDSGREAMARAIELARAATNRSHVSYLSHTSDGGLAVGKDTAAVVAHPFDARLPEARKACDAAGALLIDDETGIGAGTSGRMFAVELSGVRPDVHVLGSGWASGLAFGACVTGSSNLRWSHGSSGNPLACVAALESVRLLEGGLLESGRRLALYLEKSFARVASRILQPALWGVGLVRTLVLKADKDVAAGLVGQCLKQGLLVKTLSKDAIAVRPPLVIIEKDIEFAADVLAKVLAAFDKRDGTAPQRRKDTNGEGRDQKTGSE